MSIKGHPHRWFRAALEQRDLASAKSTARELGRLNLADALSLVILMAELRDPALDRWAAWWIARLITERRTVTIAVVDQAVVALVSLIDAEEDAHRRLGTLCADLRLTGVHGLDRQSTG